MQSETNEAPSTRITSEMVASGPHTKIVKLAVPAGESLPAHPAKGHVAIAVIAGEGRIEVAGRAFNAEPGTVIEAAPGQPHAIFAEQDMALLVVQTAA